MTHCPQPRKPSLSRLNSRRLTHRLAAGFALFALVAVPATASARCRTKPAVCARLAAQKAVSPAKVELSAATAGSPRAAATKTSAPAMLATARCTSKPSVCARLKQQQHLRPQPTTAPWPAAVASDNSNCRSKPAVCMRLRQSEPQQPVIASRQGDSSS